MGYQNHRRFVERHRARFEGPYLEVGSKDYGSTENLRSMFPGETYIGIDMESGRGVDAQVDLTWPFERVDEALDGRRFGTIFCLSVLEHCAQPFVAADTMTRLLRSGGVAYVSVPFAWKFHGYPSDYWRFTHEGVKLLFPRLVFDADVDRVSSDGENRFRALDQDIGRLRIHGGWQRRRSGLLRGLAADLLRLGGAIGPYRWLTRYRYLLTPTMVEMIGTLPEGAAEPREESASSE